MSMCIGLDLSLTATGIAIWHPLRAKCPETRLIAPKKLRGAARLDAIQTAVAMAFVHDDPRDDRPYDLVVIEDLPHFGNNAAGVLGELHGVIKVMLWRAKIRTAFVAPASLKKYATGKGNAKKTEMTMEAHKRLGYEGNDDNEADALWLLAMGMHYLGRQLCDMPERNVDAIDKVDWTGAAL